MSALSLRAFARPVQLILLLLCLFSIAQAAAETPEKIVAKSDTSKSDLGETPMSGANSVSSTAALFGALIAAAIFTI